MTFHFFHINEAYSNADGTVQFIEFVGDSDHQHLWAGHTITSSDGVTTNTYNIPTDLPNAATNGKTVLIATQGFANLGILTPDYIIPNNFLFASNGAVNFPGMNGGALSYTQLPTDGSLSLNADGSTGVNSPTDYAGNTATIASSNIISGTDDADNLPGTEGDDVFQAAAGNDTLNGQEGNDSLDGGLGIDKAIYSSSRESYSTSWSAPSFSVSGPDGNDTLSNVERLQFADKNIAIDLDAGQAGSNTARIIGAAFDAATIQARPDYVGIGLGLFDVGQNMFDVSELALSAMGTLTNEAFVNTVYFNVVGTAPSQPDRDFYMGLLEGNGGGFSQAQLLEIAANSEVNATNINLVGLQQTGIEFA